MSAGYSDVGDGGVAGAIVGDEGAGSVTDGDAGGGGRGGEDGEEVAGCGKGGEDDACVDAGAVALGGAGVVLLELPGSLRQSRR